MKKKKYDPRWCSRCKKRINGGAMSLWFHSIADKRIAESEESE